MSKIQGKWNWTTQNFIVTTTYFVLFLGYSLPITKRFMDFCGIKKCKIFASLALKGRLKTRNNLAKTNIIDNASSPYGCNEEENLEHMVFTWHHASQVWLAVGLTLNQRTTIATSLSLDYELIYSFCLKGWWRCVRTSILFVPKEIGGRCGSINWHEQFIPWKGIFHEPVGK